MRPLCEAKRMIRSMVVRNILSFALLVVALVGIGVQVRLVRMGIVGPQTRLTIAAYILIAIYAGVSIAVRLRAAAPKK
jgi:hypothetical protein